MNKKELLYHFKQDLEEANTSIPIDGVLSEEDEVIILYKGHYPEYREDLNRIIRNHNSFFDFGEEE